MSNPRPFPRAASFAAILHLFERFDEFWLRKRVWGTMQGLLTIFALVEPGRASSYQLACKTAYAWADRRFGWDAAPDPSGFNRARNRVTEDECTNLLTAAKSMAQGHLKRMKRLVCGLLPVGVDGSILHMPSPLFWLGMMVGLLFSLLLAWNLSRPMRQLRRAFAQVSQGDLRVRLYPVMRRRHDEITDVAKDFDAMAERLQVLVSAREALLHDVSHELRSPLARLQLAIGLAHQNPKNVNASLDRIEHEAGRLDRMIGELLALSRAENQGTPGEDYFDLQGLVEAVVNDARYEAQIPGVEICFSATPTTDYTVKGSAEMMRRGVENIVRNALRFSKHGQQVAVSLCREDPWLVITVSDQGPGVEENKLSSIFDPFVRVNSPLAGKGYGLGLAITRKVVLSHAGQVEAYNGADGGLVIRMRLPHWESAFNAAG